MDENMPETEGPGGLSRRDVLRRSAIVGGALVWTTPVVQSVAGPAFAQEVSPGTNEDCDEIFQFKINAGSTTFQSGQAPDCTPDGYDPNGTNFVSSNGTIPNGHGTISVVISGRTATITIPEHCQLLDGQAKAGSANGGTLQCEDASPMPGAPGTYVVTLPSRDISFVAGVICC